MKLLKQYQIYEDVKYYVLDLIEAAKDLEVIEIKVSNMYIGYEAPNDNNLLSFIEHYESVRDANLEFPIILAPCNFILDGKHRIAKAILTEKQTIKAVRFKEMPSCGIYQED